MSSDGSMLEQQRSTQFVGELLTQRLGCNLPADEVLFTKHYGPDGSAAFWRTYLSVSHSLPAFTHMLALTRAEKWDRIKVTEMALQKAIVEAHLSDELFFRGNTAAMHGIVYYHQIVKPETVFVATRSASEWLLASPQWRHLVPQTLATFLRPPQARATPSKLPTATDDEIIAALRIVYSAAEHPPNLNDVWPLVQTELAKKGNRAPKTRIQTIAEATEFAALRLKSGEHRKKS